MRREHALLGAGLVGVAASVVAAPVAAAPTDDGERYCTTTALTLEQLRSGARSDVRCHATSDEALAAVGLAPLDGVSLEAQVDGALASGTMLAVHHDNADGSGQQLWVSGDVCGGGGISLAPGDPFADRIAATTHRSCTTVKHFTDVGFAGTTQTTTGGYGAFHALNGALADRVSSIQYW